MMPQRRGESVIARRLTARASSRWASWACSADGRPRVSGGSGGPARLNAVPGARCRPLRLLRVGEPRAVARFRAIHKEPRGVWVAARPRRARPRRRRADRSQARRTTHPSGGHRPLAAHSARPEDDPRFARLPVRGPRRSRGPCVGAEPAVGRRRHLPARGRAGYLLSRSKTSARAGSSADRWRITTAPSWPSTRCRRRSRADALRPD